MPPMVVTRTDLFLLGGVPVWYPGPELELEPELLLRFVGERKTEGILG